MPKMSDQLTQERMDEIIDACATLYETMSFKDITIKEIGNITSFTRTSIYNYFHTKEEIFLSLLQREYEWWIADLNEMMKDHKTLTAHEFAHELALSLEKRERLLKLLSMNHYDMEENSSTELLASFKIAYGESIKTVERCLMKFQPQMSAAQRQAFLYIFFPFVYGIYPYTNVTSRQRQAMKDAHVGFVYHNIREIAEQCICTLLRVGSSKL